MIRILHISWSLASPSEAAALPLWSIVLGTMWSEVFRPNRAEGTLHARSALHLQSILHVPRKRNTSFEKAHICLPDKCGLFRGADNRIWTCTVAQWNLNPSCLPIPPYPPVFYTVYYSGNSAKRQGTTVFLCSFFTGPSQKPVIF